MCKFVKNVLILCLSCILVFVISVSSYAETYSYSDITSGIEIQDHAVITTNATFDEFKVYFYNSDFDIIATVVNYYENHIDIELSCITAKTGYETQWDELLNAGTRWVIYAKLDDEGKYYLYLKPGNPDPGPCGDAAPAHTHNFQWQTIIEPTIDHDGLEGEACSCGATRNTQPISAYAYAMEQYAYNKVANTGAGNTCVLEMGTMDTYPKNFMEKIAPSVLRGVTVELRFKSNQKLTKIQIPGGSVVDTSFDWYGVEKLKELYTVLQ